MLGARGFFTVIFSNLQDKERVFENGPYFHHNAGLFMRYWEECYNLDREQFLAALVWVHLFGLPIDFWVPEILEGIGNSIGRFVKIAESTQGTRSFEKGKASNSTPTGNNGNRRKHRGDTTENETTI